MQELELIEKLIPYLSKYHMQPLQKYLYQKPDFYRKEKDFSVIQSIQIGCGALLSFYSIGTRSSSPGLKQPWHEAEHSSTLHAEITNEWWSDSMSIRAIMASMGTTLLYWYE